MPRRQLDSLGVLAQYVLVARMASAVLTLVALDGGPRLIASLSLCFVLLLSFNYLALRHWPAVVHELRIHTKPHYLLLDVALSTTILSIVGAGSPLVLYLVGTALLAGLVYSRGLAAITGIVLFVGYEGVQLGQLGFLPGGRDLHTLVTLPALLLGAGFAGASIRRFMVRWERTQHELGLLREQDAVRQERLRVARDMHDSVTKNLHGLRLLAGGTVRALDRGDRDAARRAAQVVCDTADELVAQTRSVIHDLRDPVPDGGLAEALSDAVRRTIDGQELTTHVEVEESPDLADDVREQVLAVATEALHNTVKHASARTVAVRLRADGDVVLLTVRDDGQGFRPEDARSKARQGHFGLAGMRERAEQVGGRLRVDSRPGQGTLVELRIPAAAREPVASNGPAVLEGAG